MAVIEEEPSSESSSESELNFKTEATPPVYDSDGYETASETELNDTVTESENYSENSTNNVRNAENGDGEGIHDVKEEQRHEISESVESEANEKALEQSNAAKMEGNSLFKDGLFEEALLKYEIAIQIARDGPSSAEIRSICHANRATCYLKLEKYEDTVKECTKALELNPTYLKALIRRGDAREKLEQYEEAIADMTKILELDPSSETARRTIIRLKPLADEKREKMKEEMLGKMKEMGNSILGRFGMSIDNFKAVKDPNTGSYSISFQK